MLKKLTLNVSEDVYVALHQVVGQGNISQFMEALVRPNLARFKRVTSEEGRGCAVYRGASATEADFRAATRKRVQRKWSSKIK